ncbi:MAG: hypothetical protein HFJ42_07425 [Clostridia bacterium]|nr:hypothetical protein [Clostridia bacterium]
MQYFEKIRNTILKFCSDKNVPAGFEINFLQSSSSEQCQDILAIYEQASEIMEENVSESESQLYDLYQKLLKIA